MKMFILIILFVCNVFAADKGIIEREMVNGEGWSNEINIYSFKLMCDYQHYFKKSHHQEAALVPWSYVVECRETKKESDASDFKVVVKYDLTPLDTFDVKSCDRDQVIKSIFPPEQKKIYNTYEDDADDMGRPAASFLKYIKDEKCFVRKYTFQLNAAKAANRLTPDECGCDDELTPDIPKFAKFGNCIEPKLPLDYIVTGWASPGPVWTEEDKKKPKLLDCYYNHVSMNFHLSCVQNNAPDKFQAVVVYKKKPLDVFTVTSCAQEKIQNGIFPRRDMASDSVQIELWFGKAASADDDSNEQCYKRVYVKDHKSLTVDPESVFCPERDDQWVNPTWGKTGQWTLCSSPTAEKGNGPEDQGGKAGTGNGQPQAKAEQTQAQQPKAEQTQAQQPKAEQTQAQQAKAEQTQAQQPQAQQPQAQQPQAQQPQAQQATAATTNQ